MKLYLSVIRRLWCGSRAGLSLLVICLVLASASLGLVGMLGDSVRSTIERDGRKILGGDAALTLVQRQAAPEELTYLQENSEAVGQVTTLSTMARRVEGTSEALVSLKAVDELYPLVGDFEIDGTMHDASDVAERLAASSAGVYGVLVQQGVCDRLDLALGDRLILGEQTFEIRGLFIVEPDPSFGVMVFGPKVLVSMAGLRASALVQPGSLVRYHYRLKLPDTMEIAEWRRSFEETFPGRGWRVRDYTRPMANVEEGLDRTWMFLSLSALMTVLSAGIGISNGVRRFLQTQIETIASLRVLGADGFDIQILYSLLLGFIAVMSILLGLLIAAVGLTLILPLLSGVLPIALEATFGLWPLTYTLINGLLLTAVFSLPIVTSAAAVNPGILFHQGEQGLRIVWPNWVQLSVFAAFISGLLILNIAFAERPILAGIFIGCSLGLLAVLWGVARCVAFLCLRLSPRRFLLRYTLGALVRPGAVTGQVVVSLGLGLSVLVLINALETNITHRMDAILENEAPSFYFIDIQPEQLTPFTEIVAPYQEQTTITAMVRGRLTHFKGTAVAALPENEEYGWITRGDRAFTWSAEWQGDQAVAAPVVEGTWWPADYNGSLLVSFDYDAAQSFGLSLGDRLGLNILGRDFEAEIVNFRKINWEDLGMNFVVVLSPGVISQAPHSYIAAVYSSPEQELALQKAVVAELPNVSALRLKDVLAKISTLLSKMVITIRSLSGVSVVVGIVVLISALVAVQAQKSYENQILRVLGADRRKLFAILALELLLLGSIAALIAAAAGTLIALAIVRFGFNSDFVFDGFGIVSSVVLGQAVTLIVGLAIAWRGLGSVQLHHLRNE